MKLIVALSLALGVLTLICCESYAANEAPDCNPFSECVSSYKPDSYVEAPALAIKGRGGDILVNSLGILRPTNGSLQFDFERWLWTRFDKKAVLERNPSGPAEAYRAFSKLMMSTVDCANAYQGRDYMRSTLVCRGLEADGLNFHLKKALEDGYLQQLGIVQTVSMTTETGEKYTAVRSPILDRVGITSVNCYSANGCIINYKPGSVGERPAKLSQQTSDADGKNSKTVSGVPASMENGRAPSDCDASKNVCTPLSSRYGVE